MLPCPQRFYVHKYFDGQHWQDRTIWDLDEQGIITDITPAPTPPPDMPRIMDRVIPGLIDLQVNGGGGILLNDDCSPAALEQMIDAHAATGTLGLAATLITDERGHWRNQIRQLIKTLDHGMIGLAACHLEGPWLSPARPGTHAPEAIRGPEDADWPLIEQLLKRSPVLITLAPECVPITDLERLHRLGAVLFAGHSECPPDLFASLRTKGMLRGVTHLYNAMPLGSSRNPGLAACALADPDCAFGLIADGIHVGDVFLDIALRAHRADKRAILVSDAMPPVGQIPPRPFQLYQQTIRVEKNQCINESGNLAGAALPLMACAHYLRKRGYSLDELLPMMTTNPAMLIQHPRHSGTLKPGNYADFVQLDADDQPIGIYRAGRRLLPP